MNQKISQDIAFFNLLKGLIAPTLGNESFNYKVSIEDLAGKMEMDTQIISNSLKKLQGEGLIKVLDTVNGEINLHFDRTHEKLLEIVSIDKIEEKIDHMAIFIEKKMPIFNLYNLDHINKSIEKYTRLVKERIDLERKIDPNANPYFNDIIKKGIIECLKDEKNLNLINRIIFNIAKDADEDDLVYLEEIIYYILNLPIEENPFYVTLFLTGVSFQIEHL